MPSSDEDMTFCGECGAEIEGEYFIGPKGKPWCQKCAKKAAGKCKICKKTLLGSGEVLHVGGQAFHKSCFKCNMCGVPIQGEFKRKKNAIADKAKREKVSDAEFICMDCCPLFEEFEIQDFKRKQTGRAPSLDNLGSGEERLCQECGMTFSGEYKKKKDLIKDKKLKVKCKDDDYVCMDCAPMVEAMTQW